jgi:hypothetical protein
MCKQNIISNKFDLNLTTTLSSYMAQRDQLNDTQHNYTCHEDTEHNGLD